MNYENLERKEDLIGNQKIINNDCMEELKGMPSGSVDVFIFSPPYNIGLKYNTYKDNSPRSQYLIWLYEIGDQIKRIMKPNGSFFLNVGGTNIDPCIPSEVLSQLRSLFILQNNIVWVKSISISEVSHGHFKPINSKRFLNHNHESIFHLTINGDVSINRLAIGVPYTHKSNVDRWKHDGEPRDKRCAGDVWFIPYETVQNKAEKFNHPAGYPVELVCKCLNLHGGNNLTVVDPLMGAGTTMVACQKLGHHGIGIEMDEEYYCISKKRIEESVNLLPFNKN